MDLIRRISDLESGNKVLLGGDEYVVVQSQQVGVYMVNIHLKQADNVLARSIFRYSDEFLEIRE